MAPTVPLELERIALTVAREAAQLILAGFRGQHSVSLKAGNEPVTEYDVRSEELVRRLSELGLSAGGGVLRTKANCLQVCSGGPVAVVHDTLVAGALQPPDQVGAHPAEADHAKLHPCSFGSGRARMLRGGRNSRKRGP